MINIAIAILSFFVAEFILYCVFAFFDGWDGKTKEPLKIYKKIFAIGYSLHLAQTVKKLKKDGK